MGQTLPNGIYLPAEGERNCYDGLEGNWRSLDSLISTVAGKASATHTHGNISNDGKVGTTANKPLITGTSGAVQAGSFGNQANTFCEGNDSRLSDARTPVAHTHLTADVTDLLNSAHTWTGDNTYTKYQNIVIDGVEIGVAPTNQNRNGLLFKDKNGVNIGWLRHQYDTSGDISIEMLVSNKYKNGALDPTGTQVYQGVKQTITSNGVSYFSWSGYVNNSLYPYTTETFNIGDSTHQWNNLYAKNYYYNGTAWGLDKANTWSNINTYQREICISGDRDAYIAPMWESASSGIAFLNSDATKTFIFGQHTTDANNRKVVDGTKGRILIRTGERNSETVAEFEPRATNATLGTSTNKWKTLNGVNPGALSLPSSSYMEIDTTNWDLTGATSQSYTPTVPGWLYISIQNIAGNYLSINSGRGAISMDGTGAQSGLRAMLLVIANESVSITVKTGSIFAARFYPCLGNV